MDDPEDIEEQCENAVFEVCDARERFPKRCAEELGKYLNIKNNVAMAPIILKPAPQVFEIPEISYRRENCTLNRGNDGGHCLDAKNGAEQLQSMINKVQELKVVLKQLEDNRNFEIKHYLK